MRTFVASNYHEVTVTSNLSGVVLIKGDLHFHLLGKSKTHLKKKKKEKKKNQKRSSSGCGGI